MNPSKQKGTAFETLIVEYLKGAWWPYAERRAGRGANDGGDVAGIPGVVIEAKNERRFDMAGWLREVDAEVDNADADLGVVVFKRKGTTDAAKQYALLTFGDFCQLLHEAGR